jgi:hypothetical protein
MFRFESDWNELLPDPHLHHIHPSRGAFCCIGAPRANHRGKACLETRLYQCCYADVFSTFLFPAVAPRIGALDVLYSIRGMAQRIPVMWHTVQYMYKVLFSGHQIVYSICAVHRQSKWDAVYRMKNFLKMKGINWPQLHIIFMILSIQRHCILFYVKFTQKIQFYCPLLSGVRSEKSQVKKTDTEKKFFFVKRKFPAGVP